MVNTIEHCFKVLNAVHSSASKMSEYAQALGTALDEKRFSVITDLGRALRTQSATLLQKIHSNIYFKEAMDGKLFSTMQDTGMGLYEGSPALLFGYALQCPRAKSLEGYQKAIKQYSVDIDQLNNSLGTQVKGPGIGDVVALLDNIFATLDTVISLEAKLAAVNMTRLFEDARSQRVSSGSEKLMVQKTLDLLAVTRLPRNLQGVIRDLEGAVADIFRDYTNTDSGKIFKKFYLDAMSTKFKHAYNYFFRTNDVATTVARLTRFGLEDSVKDGLSQAFAKSKPSKSK